MYETLSYYLPIWFLQIDQYTTCEATRIYVLVLVTNSHQIIKNIRYLFTNESLPVELDIDVALHILASSVVLVERRNTLSCLVLMVVVILL